MTTRLKDSHSTPPLSKAEVATHLRVCERTVQKLLKARKFPNAFRVGTHWRIPRTDLDSFIRAQTQTAMAG